MKYREFKLLLENRLISTVRVVPIPLSKGWCIDVLIKELLDTGSRTDILESDRSTRDEQKVRRFASIDSAASYLHKLGVNSFVVEMDDAISFVNIDAKLLSKDNATTAQVDQNHGVANDAPLRSPQKAASLQ